MIVRQSSLYDKERYFKDSKIGNVFVFCFWGKNETCFLNPKLKSGPKQREADELWLPNVRSPATCWSEEDSQVLGGRGVTHN